LKNSKDVDQIKIINEDNLYSTIKDVLVYVSKKGDKDLALCLQDKLSESLPGLEKSTIKKIVSDSIEYVDSITDMKKSLKLSKDRGMNREEWVYRQFQDIGEERGLSDNEFGALAHSLQESIYSKFQDVINERARIKNIQPDFNLLPESAPSEGWNESNIKDRFLDTTKIVNGLTVIGLSQIDETNAVSLQKSTDTPLSEYLDKSIFTDDSTDIEKSIVIALKIAEDKKDIEVPDIFETLISTDPEIENVLTKVPTDVKDDLGKIPIFSTLAAESVDFLKIANKLGNGEIDADEAVDEVVDSTTAAATGAAKVAFRKGGVFLGSKVGAFVGGLLSTVVGPAAIPVCTKVGSMVGGFIGEKVAEPVVRGLNYIGQQAKKAAHSVVETVKSVASKVGDIIGSAISSFFSFFS
jgi:hypothetical protein